MQKIAKYAGCLVGAVVIAFLSGIAGYQHGYRTANREWANDLLNSMSVTWADRAAHYASDLLWLRSPKDPQPKIRLFEKFLAGDLDKVGRVDTAGAGASDRAQIYQDMESVGKYYELYPPSDLSEQAQKAVQLGGSAP